MAPRNMRFTTRELSLRTFPDFERFFAQVHGCACTLYFLGQHLTPVPGTAKRRAELIGAPDRSRRHYPLKELTRRREAAAVRDLLRQGRAHGILVYAEAEPVGWCHFGRAADVPIDQNEKTPTKLVARDPSSQWRITCFTTRMDFRRQGVASTALAAAIAAIKKHGGGWIEATPMAFPHDDPMVRKLRRTFGWGSQELTDYVKNNWPSREVPGIGRVSACMSSSRTMGHMGTMSMFSRLGFEAVGIDDARSSDDPRYPPSHFLVMRLKV